MPIMPSSTSAKCDICPPPCPDATSSHPIRYSNGEIRLSEVDLEFNGFGRPWGQTRSYSNILVPGQVGPTGTNWYVSQLPYIVGSAAYGYGGSGGNPAVMVVVVPNPYGASTYNLQGTGPNYLPQYAQLETLTYDAAANQYVWMQRDGSQNITMSPKIDMTG